MSTFTYFAYGSNMLTTRLRQRCPTARPIGGAIARGHSLSFAKAGLDGSGKATMIEQSGSSGAVHGVLFEIAIDDRPALDHAEARYLRTDDFRIFAGAAHIERAVTSYIALPEAVDDSLVPFDWYLALVVSGGEEHGLPEHYIAALRQVIVQIDPQKDRPGRIAALHCMRKSHGIIAS